VTKSDGLPMDSSDPGRAGEVIQSGDIGIGSRDGVSVIVPCYRSGATLPRLIDRVVKVMNAINKPFEVVLVEDGSGDATWRVIESAVVADARVRGIRLSRNYGQHNALLCGIRAAQYSSCVTLDDDLQNPPEEIPRLLGALDAGTDVVYGTPRQGQHGVFRNAASALTKWTLRHSMNTPVAVKISAFRVFKTRVRESFRDFNGALVSIDVLLSWGTPRFGSIVVQHDQRDAGISGYSLGKLLVHAMNMVTGFSTVPLRVASVLGLLFAILGFLSLGYVLVRYAVSGVAVPGFAFLASALSVFSGVQLLVMGIMGEYIGRVFMHVCGKPVYTIAETAHRRAPSGGV
jgi:glycosyltransferase involved in cell wall biosynthesis